MPELNPITPEEVADRAKMPIEGLRVLRELMDAAHANDPMQFLIRAHGELEAYINTVRESYINRASGLLASAGASAELEMLHPFPAKQYPERVEKPKTGNITGFQPNKEEN